MPVINPKTLCLRQQSQFIFSAQNVHYFLPSSKLFLFRKAKQRKNTDGRNRSAVHVTEVLILVFIAVNRVTYPK